MDRLDAMSVFMEIVRAGSFSAASRQLGMPLATVSRKIADLEAHLKTGLIKRPARPLALTEAGEAYLDACRQIIAKVEEAERDASGEYEAPKGELTVTAPMPLGHMHLIPIALEFLATYPEIRLRLILSDRVTNMIDENIDAAIRIGELADSSMIATRVGSIRHVVCASPGYFDARGRPQVPQDLVDHECVTVDNYAPSRQWTFTDGPGEIKVPIRSRLDVNTSEAGIIAAIAGVGVTRVMSYKIEQARSAGELEVVLKGFEPTPWPVNIIHPAQRLVPLKLRTFIDWVAPRLRARLAEPA